MRELTLEEVEDVNGGFGVVGATIGAVTGGVSAAYNGGNAGQIAAATILGGVSGWFGGLASASSGFARGMWGAYAVEVGVIGNATTSDPSS